MVYVDLSASLSLLCKFQHYLLIYWVSVTDFFIKYMIFNDVMKWSVSVCFLICPTLSVHLIFFSTISIHRACVPPPIFFIKFKFQKIKNNENIYNTFENINLNICFLNRTYKILVLYMLVLTLSITWWT